MRKRLWGLLVSTGLSLATVSPVLAQQSAVQPVGFRNWGKKQECCPIPCMPCLPVTPSTPTTPDRPMDPMTPRTPDQPIEEPSFSPEQFAATGGGETFAAASSAVGYIDSAMPLTRFRFRYDAAWGNNRPDRAEYFYGKCGCFRTAGVDPNAPGPVLEESNVNYQDLRPYFEYALAERFSVFLETPVRFLDPTRNANTGGYADMNTGAKYAMILTEDQVLTFQLRTYIPTGDADRGLGTNHVSLEPGLLYYRQLTERLGFEAEFKDWIPVNGTDFAGNVLQYGAGLGFKLYDNGNFRVVPIMEYVGWTVLDGKQFLFPENVTQSAGGDTIINGKWGVRAGFGPQVGLGQFSRFDVYIGYGRALTGTVWYKDIARIETRLNF